MLLATAGPNAQIKGGQLAHVPRRNISHCQLSGSYTAPGFKGVTRLGMQSVLLQRTRGKIDHGMRMRKQVSLKMR